MLTFPEMASMSKVRWSYAVFGLGDDVLQHVRGRMADACVMERYTIAILLYCHHMTHQLAAQCQDSSVLVNVDEVLVLDIRHVIECLVSNAVRLGIFCSLWIRVATSFHTQINNVR